MLNEINILTIFPDFFNYFLEFSIIKNAIKKKKIKINVINFRDYSKNKHKKVDDYAYGGFPGMLLMCQPIVDCLEKTCLQSHKIIISPRGKSFNNKIIQKLINNYSSITFICGHYEGFDERIYDYVDESMKIDNFITSSGETIVQAMIDGIIRQIPGVINKKSLLEESFNNNTIEYPQYTRPKVFKNKNVPNVLISGNHKDIEKWKNNNKNKLKNNN